MTMDPILIAVISITTVFVAMLLVKKALERLIKHPLCAICVAVSVTWLTLLALNIIGAFDDKVLIALLMGQTIIGLYYLIEQKAAEQLMVFRLPLLLTLTAAGYSIIIGRHSYTTMGFLAVVWGAFLVIFAFKDRGTRAWFNRAVECCKRW
jgi:hypothetical protein